LLCFEAPRHHPSTRSYRACVCEAQALLLLRAPYRRVAGPGAPLFADLITVGCLSGGFDMRRGAALWFSSVRPSTGLFVRLQGCASVYCRVLGVVMCMWCVPFVGKVFGLVWRLGTSAQKKNGVEPAYPSAKGRKNRDRRSLWSEVKIADGKRFHQRYASIQYEGQRRGGGLSGGEMDQMSKGICAGTYGQGLAAPAQPPDGLEPHRPWEGLDEMHNIVRHQSDATWCDRHQEGAREGERERDKRARL
jgi:hypothetical protein